MITLNAEKLERLKKANQGRPMSTKSVSSRELIFGVKRADEEKLPSEICRELKSNGIDPDLCNFIQKVFMQLQKAKANSKPLESKSLQAFFEGLTEPLTPDECKIDDLVTILFSLEKALKNLKGFSMRMNQVSALLLLLFGSHKAKEIRGQLLELATGEGKSCVIAYFATIQALSKKKVDIICSSPILASRDEQEWRPFYSQFGLQSSALPVKDNAYKKAYQSQIVYGTVGDFSADDLRESFDDLDTRGSRRFDSLIVDEVDHLTLDSCLNLTYLSHQGRGLHHLTTIFAIIWQLVSAVMPLGQESQSDGFVKSPQLFPGFLASLLKACQNETDEDGKKAEDEFTEIEVIEMLVGKGYVSKDAYKGILETLENFKVDDQNDENNNIQQVQNGLKDFAQILMAEMGKGGKTPELTISQILQDFDIQCNIFMLDQDNLPITIHKEKESENNLLIFPNGHVAIFFKDQEHVVQVIKKEVMEKLKSGQINIPSFLMTYVEKMLERFIENAILSAFCYAEGTHYKIASSRDAKNVNDTKNDVIVPIDFTSTGVLEKNKVYSEGIQQFLEMKHQLAVSDSSLTTNFMSNFYFYSRYKEIHGLSGTLGNDWDQKFLDEKLQLKCISVPRHKRNLVKDLGLQIIEEETWVGSIREEIREFNQRGQPLLVICKDMNTAEEIFDQSKDLIPQSQLINYWRDDTHSLPKKALDPGDVVISTALASRGTDIHISKKALQKGGLHVVLTYLPRDGRTERQIIGRTGRKGEPGSFKLVLCQSTLASELGGHFQGDEVRLRRDVIEASRIDGLKDSLDAVIFQEKLFANFCNHFNDLKADFSIVEKNARKEQMSSSMLKRLRLKIRTRELDFEPTRDALKEAWASWFTLHGREIQRAGSRKDKNSMDRLSKDLDDFLIDEKKRLKNGVTSNFFHYIEHARGRHELFGAYQGQIEIDFVIDAWRKVENQVTNEDDKRYISAAFYNLAFLLLKKNPDQDQEVVALLKKAQKGLDQRFEDFVVSSKLKKSIEPIAKSHVQEGTDENVSNLFLQSDSEGMILENFRKNLQETIQKLEARNKKENDLIVKDKEVKELFKKEDCNPIVDREISAFNLDGHYFCFDVEEKPKTNRWGAFLCFLLGAAQVLGGIALCVCSAGFASSVGINFITEGISDCIEGVKGMITGAFSWVQWAIGKVISLATSLLCFGIGKAMKWFKTGSNMFKGLGSKFVSGFTTHGAKQSLKQALKFTAKKVIVQGSMALIDVAMEKVLEEAVKKVMDNFKGKFVKAVKEDAKIQEAIERAVNAKAEDLRRKGFGMTPTVLESIKKDVIEVETILLNDAFADVLKDHQSWRDFHAIFKQVRQPIEQIAKKKLVPEDKMKIFKVVQFVISTSLTATELGLGIKELNRVHEELAGKIINGLKKVYGQCNDSNEQSDLKNVAKDCQDQLAEKFGQMYIEKMSSTTSTCFNSTLKNFAMKKMSKNFESKISMKKHAGYFRTKRHELGQFHIDPKAPRNAPTKEEIIQKKQGKESDIIDVIAAGKKLQKNIVIETYDENGKLIKSDKTPGNFEETITLRNTKTKNEDGTFSGHFELKNGERIHFNDGEENSCFYKAICQSEGHQNVQAFRQSALNGLDENHLQALNQRQKEFKGKGETSEFSIEGGGVNKKQLHGRFVENHMDKDDTRPKQKNTKVEDLNNAKFKSLRKEGQGKGERHKGHKNQPENYRYVTTDEKKFKQTGQHEFGKESTGHPIIMGMKEGDKFCPLHLEAEATKQGDVYVSKKGRYVECSSSEEADFYDYESFTSKMDDIPEE